MKELAAKKQAADEERKSQMLLIKANEEPEEESGKDAVWDLSKKLKARMDLLHGKGKNR